MSVDNTAETWDLPEDSNNQPKSFFGKDPTAPDPLFVGQFSNISGDILFLQDPIQETVGYSFAGINLACGLISLIFYQKLNAIIPYNIAKVLFVWSILLRFLSGFFLNSSRISYMIAPLLSNLDIISFYPGTVAYWIERVLAALGKGAGLTCVILHLAVIHVLYRRGRGSSRPWLLFTHLVVIQCTLLASIFWFIFAHWTAGYYGMLFFIWFLISMIGGLIWDIYAKSPDEKDAPLTVAYTKGIYIVGVVSMLNVIAGYFTGSLGICMELMCDNPIIIVLSLSILYGIYRSIWKYIQKIYKSGKLLFPPKKTKVVSLQAKPEPEPFFIRVAPPQRGRKFDSISQIEPRDIVTIPDLFGGHDPNVPPPSADVYKVD